MGAIPTPLPIIKLWCEIHCYWGVWTRRHLQRRIIQPRLHEDRRVGLVNYLFVQVCHECAEQSNTLADVETRHCNTYDVGRNHVRGADGVNSRLGLCRRPYLDSLLQIHKDIQAQFDFGLLEHIDDIERLLIGKQRIVG
jgi:hypothetical protein